MEEKGPVLLGELLDATAASTTGPVAMSGHSVSSMAHRLQTARRLVLGLPSPPAEGTPLRLVIAAGAVEDPFLNSLAADWSQELTWSSDDTVIVDVAAPEVHAVGLREGHLEVTFSEEPDLAAATAAIDAGTPLTWILSDDRYTLRSEETLAAGTFTFTVAPTLTDLAGTSLPSVFSLELTIEGRAPDADFFVRPDPRFVETSTAGNGFGFHGLPVDAETALVYVRHRYYDPETGRFISTDPLGYVDSPNLYQYGLNNPVNISDPMGLEAGDWWDPRTHIARAISYFTGASAPRPPAYVGLDVEHGSQRAEEYGALGYRPTSSLSDHTTAYLSFVADQTFRNHPLVQLDAGVGLRAGTTYVALENLVGTGQINAGEEFIRADFGGGVGGMILLNFLDPATEADLERTAPGVAFGYRESNWVNMSLLFLGEGGLGPRTRVPRATAGDLTTAEVRQIQGIVDRAVARWR